MTVSKHVLGITGSHLLSKKGLDYLHDTKFDVPSSGLKNILKYSTRLTNISLYGNPTINEKCWPDIIATINDNKDWLERLEINIEGISPYHLNQLSNLRLPNLHHFGLKVNKDFPQPKNQKSVWKFTSSCERLTSLELRSSFYLSWSLHATPTNYYLDKNYKVTLSRLESLCVYGNINFYMVPFIYMPEGTTSENLDTTLHEVCPKLHTFKCTDDDVPFSLDEFISLLKFNINLVNLEVKVSYGTIKNTYHDLEQKFSGLITKNLKLDSIKISFFDIHSYNWLDLSKAMPFLTRLEYSGPDSHNRLPDFLDHCKMLTSVVISNYGVIPIPSDYRDYNKNDFTTMERLSNVVAANLKLLCLKGVALSFVHLITILQSCPNLMQLHLTECNVNSDDDIVDDQSLQTKISIINTSSCTMNGVVLLRLLRCCVNTLQKLTLQKIILRGYIPEHQCPIMYFPLLNRIFVSLYKGKNSDNDEDIITTALLHFKLPSLQHFSYRSNFDRINTLLSSFNSLSSLDLAQCSDETLNIISERKHRVPRLDTEVCNITTSGLLQIPLEIRSELEELRIIDARITDTEALCSFLKTCPNLIYLSVGTGEVGPTNEVFETLLHSCPQLEYIILGGWGDKDKLSREVVEDVVKGLKCLKLLMMNTKEGIMTSKNVKSLQDYCRRVLLKPAPKLVLSLISEPYTKRTCCMS
ncbi:hypothetical protein AKO1_010142 [Acrasis kona]|uniref:Uncharacterized protein n=1 Tax=Acrasis kona TaxID=1008807 RepID=A0AAW2ZRB3_9EUKA